MSPPSGLRAGAGELGAAGSLGRVSASPSAKWGSGDVGTGGCGEPRAGAAAGLQGQSLLRVASGTRLCLQTSVPHPGHRQSPGLSLVPSGRWGGSHGRKELPEPGQGGDDPGKMGPGAVGTLLGTHPCTLHPPAFSGVLSTPRPPARVLAHVTLYRSQVVGGESMHRGLGAGWCPGPHPRPPTSVGFPQGEAPAAHSWCGLGGRELEKDVPPELLRRGHRRPSEPQAGLAGPPPCPQPPSYHLPLSLLGERGGAGPHSSAHGPSPHLACPNLLPSLAGPVPAGRGPSGRQRRSPPDPVSLRARLHPVRVLGTHCVLAQEVPPPLLTTSDRPWNWGAQRERGQGRRPAGQRRQRCQDRGLHQMGTLAPTLHPGWHGGLPRRGRQTRPSPTRPVCILSGITAGRRGSMPSLVQGNRGQDGRPWARDRGERVPEAGTDSPAGGQAAVPCSH